ncbi:ATP-binding protein [Micromonospora endolithica]|uniref:LuxR family transcriptional regulator n=1 Tax=Micromonospora endolithica TaxID=230091 RepID=A0A3A9ZHA9_9ACTN|nr:LuxR family transcriptional regulator [Micromonospora endolithica]RKN47589.1 LuxR family transcriptional regulator [Micromonospora endolithica]TWJ21238.1 putative ATPase [Micromonospora endolithica]
MTPGLENASTSPRFVGRRPQLARIGRARAAALSRGRQMVCEVVGEPGIGKTRLVREALQRYVPTVPWAVGTCAPDERGVPFHVFRHAFTEGRPPRRGLSAERSSAATEEIWADSAAAVPPPPAQASDAQRFRTYQLARRLIGLAARDGLVLVLDDLHWADASSTGLITHLLRYPVPAPLLLVLVYRPRQTATPMPFGPPDSDGRAAAEPTSRDRIELRPLSLAEAALLYPHVDEAELRARYDLTGGNPGYLAALPGEPTRHGGESIREPRRVRLSDAAVAVLRREWTDLPSVERDCLRAAAIFDAPFTTDLLAEVARVPTALAVEVGWRLARRDLIRHVPGAGRFALRHPVLRMAVSQDTDQAWWMEASARALTALVERGAPATDQVRYALRLLTLPNGRWVEPCVDVLLRAAQETRREAPELAVRWLRLALRALPPAAGSTRRRDVSFTLAQIIGESGELAESRALLQEIVPLFPADSQGRRARAVAHWARVERLLGNYAEAAAISRRELAVLPDGAGPAGGDRLATEIGVAGILAGRPMVGSPDAPPMQPGGSGADRAGLLAVRSLAAAHDGALDAARGLLDAGTKIIDSLPDRDVRDHPDCLTALGLTELYLERQADAVRHLDRGLNLVRASRRDDGLCQLLLGRSQVAYHAGQLATAIDLVTEAGIVARRIGSPDLLSFALAFEAEATAWRGGPRDDDRAVALARSAAGLATDLATWSGRTAATALATAALLAGDPATCAELVRSAGGDSRLSRLQSTLRPRWYELLCAAALAEGEMADAERLARMAMVEADQVGLVGQRGYAESAYGEVLLARGEVSVALHHLETAADLFRVSGMVLRRSLALASLARAAEAAGRSGPAALARRRALELAGWCGTERVGLRLARPAGPREAAALTDREWRIAQLAATGATSRLIGRQLHISPRTVEAHLTRIYRKAGVASRSGLVAWVARLDDTDR